MGRNPINRLPPSEGNLPLTKVEIARRQIITAISLFFRASDPVSIHVLASAADEILDKITKARGIFNFREREAEYIRDEFKPHWRSVMNEAYNFMKHAGQKNDEVYRYFNPAINEILILQCVIAYWSVAKIEPIMILYLAWHEKFKPGLIKSDMPLHAAFEASGMDWPAGQSASFAMADDLIRDKGWDMV